MAELFNYDMLTIGDKTFITAQRWREGFTVPECVIVREADSTEIAEVLGS